MITSKPYPQFILNDEIISLNAYHPHQTLLQFLRTCKNLTGTKEGCAEGDCGACTVVLADLQDGRLVFSSATSCILFLGFLINKAVITIEFLSRQVPGSIQIEIHPLQKMFIEQHASQCGFCTPGFVMSAAAHRFQTVYDPPSGTVSGDLEYRDISEIIAGNLCRCTGYGPLVKAIQKAQDWEEPFWMRERLDGIKEKLLRLQDEPIPDQKIVFTGKGGRAVSHAPVTEGELGKLLERYPGSRLVAGATDLGLWATKKLTRWERLIHVHRIPELREIIKTEDALWIGAGVTLTKVTETLIRYQPHLTSYLKRFAATQIRNTGTIGGNIANGSPIGDLPPLLIALGSTLILKKKLGGDLASRQVKIEDYFLDYGKQSIESGEWISRIRIPLGTLCSGRVRAYKISKRLEQDISIVSLGVYCERKDNKIDSIILAYGGMAGIPKRATKTEAALRGQELTLENLQAASRFLEKDYQPLSDHRGKRDYRLEAAKGLLIRYYYDLEGRYQDLYSKEFFEKKCYRDVLHPSIPVDITDSTHMYSCVGKHLAHDSALLHVTGRATYTDDLPLFEGTLHMALIPSPVAKGKLDEGFVEMLRNQNGSAAMVSWLDIPGNNTISHGEKEVLFSDGELQFLGQPLGGVMAGTHEAAKRWVKDLMPVFSEYCRKTDPPILTIDEALEKKSFIAPSVTLEKTPKGKGIEEVIQASPHRVKGNFYLGGQDHFYLEGQVAYAKPEEDGGMLVYSSTQHPSEVQHIVAGILGVDYHRVRVVVRRMGGGFGGKESQANFVAAAAALGAFKTKKPVKLRLDRDDDMIMTGKRHDFRFDYEVGFDGEGNIQALSVVQSVRCGYSLDLSLPVAGRALCHADNAYYLPCYKIVSHRLKTDTVSNTAFRGFGGPQGMIGMERIIDQISFELGLDPVEVRKRNLYDSKGQEGNRCITPYGMKVEDNILPPMIEKLLVDSNYHSRRQEIREWNRTSPVYKRGLGFNPVKFGISFNVSFLNQAGALVHIYQDGSVKINHGGTEMGQGLMIKCAQVAAERLQLPLDRIQITATDTDKVPNTSATAASSGSDLNGMAIAHACDILRSRLNRVFLEQLPDSPKRGDEDNIIWKNGEISFLGEKITFTDLVKRAYLSRVSLSSTGYYRTPKIHWDIKKFEGRPFYYFAYGVAISEVIIDTLTGESRPLRADLLHDVGHSLNPSIDQGQIEGGYIQGMGWLTSEELYWDKEGRFMTHAPSTYKIPTSFDRPEMHLFLYQSRSQEGGGNSEPTIYRSKAVGEPPLMLAISHFLAIRDAIAAVRDYTVYPDLNAPATPQEILFTLRGIS